MSNNKNFLSTNPEKRDIIEEKRVRKNVRAKNRRDQEIKRKRNLKLAVFCTIFSIIVILGAAYIIVHCISNKENLRDAGIAAFNEGGYTEAISDFESSLAEQQWFSSKMDQDTRLYLAACYMRIDDYEKANEIYKEVRDNKPTVMKKDELDKHMNLAIALNEVKSGSVNEIYINSLKEEYDKGNTSVSLYLGTCYEILGDYENMIKYYDIYTDAYGMNTYIAYQESSYYLSQNDNETAQSIVNMGINATDDLYIDLVLYNDIILTERQLDYAGALEKATALIEKYPNNETYKREYDFLNSRVNIDPNPVHTEGDADAY